MTRLVKVRSKINAGQRPFDYHSVSFDGIETHLTLEHRDGRTVRITFDGTNHFSIENESIFFMNNRLIGNDDPGWFFEVEDELLGAIPGTKFFVVFAGDFVVRVCATSFTKEAV